MYSQHSIGLDAACKDTVLPVAWLMWTRKTIRTRVFLRPMSVSPFLSSMSELRSFKIPAQSILRLCGHGMKSLSSPQGKSFTLSRSIRLWFIHAALQPNQKWFSPWSPSTEPWRRLQSCQQKINTTTHKQSFYTSVHPHLGKIQTQ